MDAQAQAEKSAENLWQKDQASKSLGMVLEEVTPGGARMSMRVRDDMVNGVMTCHGGIVFSLADSTFAFACNSAGKFNVAQHCSITFIAPARLGDSLSATARMTAQYGRNGIYDIEIRNQGDVLIACFRGHARQIDGQH